MAHQRTCTTEESIGKELANAFSIFDADMNGVVTYKEFRRVLSEVTPLPPPSPPPVTSISST